MKYRKIWGEIIFIPYLYHIHNFFGVFNMGKSIKVKDLVQEGRSIHEKFNKKMNETPFGNPLIGNIPPGMPGQSINIKELVKDYVIFRKEEEYSTNMEDTKEAEMQIKSLEQQIKKMKGNTFFEMVHELSRLVIYNEEYASMEESREIEQQIRQMAPKLGISANDYI